MTNSTDFPLTPATSLDPELIAKYNLPAPRYTSYPTALRFQGVDAFSEGRDLLAGLAESAGPISLYFHLPFCRSLCWFCGCAKVISTQTGLADRYLAALEKEVSLYRPYLNESRRVSQLHFGGGTPNFLTPSQIERLDRMVHTAFAFEDDAEMSVELDPRTLTQAKVEAFRRLGINRASIGVQDVNPQVQAAIHRIQPSEMNRRSVAWLREAGIQSLNLDLIYGLPHQTAASFQDTLEESLSYDPERLAIFSYAHVPWSKPAQKMLERTCLPSAESKLEILMLIQRFLAKRGYVHIGMDHFVKASDSLAQAQAAGTLQRNFQGYSLHADAEICAFGMSAISQSGAGYRQNCKDLNAYYKSLERGVIPLERGYLLTRDDRIRRDTIMRLMCDAELDFEARGSAWGVDFRDYFRAELALLEPLESDGLLEIAPGGIVLTALGRLLIRNVAMRFDAYLGAGTLAYSKAV